MKNPVKGAGAKAVGRTFLGVMLAGIVLIIIFTVTANLRNKLASMTGNV